MALDFDGGLTLALQTRDIDAAIAWYGRVLGFTLLYKADDIGWCEMTSPVARVNVGLSEVETIGQGGGATPTFGVTDIAAAQALMAELDVRTDGDIRHIPGLVKLLTIYDGDDNAIMLYEMDGPAASS